MKEKRFWVAVLFALQLLASNVLAQGAGLEAEAQDALQKSRELVGSMAEKLRTGASVAAELGRLRDQAEHLQVTHLLLGERFQARSARLAEVNNTALIRQQAMAERYQELMAEFLDRVAALPLPQSLTVADLLPLHTLLDRIPPRKNLPLLGSLPYSHLNYPAREPATTPLIVPAFRGGNSDVTAADTLGTTDAPLTAEIVELAKSLDWNPVRIYEWVQENIATEWYWGSMKGAEETLHQRSGNDADQAALLIAMLRSAGFPARYVRGTIEFFPGIEQAKRLTGLDDPLKIAAFLQKAGIPFAPIIAGGKIANFRIEHIWVETEIPYANYRGALVDSMGKTWIALDTHLKPAGYRWNESEDFRGDFNLAALRDDYLSQPRTETPLAYLRSAFNQSLGNFSAATFQDYLRTRTLVVEPLGILPNSLQFSPTVITGEYTELPADLCHQVTFAATGTDGSELFTLTVAAASLSNRSVSLFYEPETVQDQKLIDSYGGLDNTPSYLVRLRPVLRVDGERKVVGRNGLLMGSDYLLTIGLTSPNGRQEVVSHQVIGDLSSLGIVSQKVVPPTGLPPEGKDAERLLHETALAYIEHWNAAEEELAAFLKVAIVRPLPTVVTTGGVIDVSYLFDVPHGFDWKGVFIDAGFRRIETVAAAGQEERAREFMRLSALEGSILENRIFEDNFGVVSISTAKLLALAPSSLAPLLTLDSANVDALLPMLDLAENVKADIGNAVHQGFSVTVPEAEIVYKNWSGIGYIKENPATGEAGYMLSGMIAGGMTAEEWVNQVLSAQFENAYSEPPNQDPGAAARIVMIPVSDRQNGTVGQKVEEPLAVLVVDLEGRPVAGAEVTFTALAGGAHFDGSATVQVTTGSNGIAKSRPTLGSRTKDNPSYQRANQGDAYVTQIGVNLFNASVSGRQGQFSLAKPFEAFGCPDLPVSMVKIFGDGNSAMANNPAGTLRVLVVDQYENPVSNVPVTYQAESAASMDPQIDLPQGYRSITFYNQNECASEYPLYGECDSSTGITRLTAAQYGAGVNTILGNTVNTRYVIRANAPGLPDAIFTVSSGGYWEKDGYLPSQLFIRHLTRANNRGEAVNAAKAGEQLKKPLVATMFKMTSDYTMEGPSTCTKNDSDGQPYQTQCWSIKGTGLVKTERINDGTVLFTPLSGGGSLGSTENPGDGTYQSTYSTGLIPSLNQIEAIGQAIITVPQVYSYANGVQIEKGYTVKDLPLRTVTLQSGQKGLFDQTTGELLPQTPQKIAYEVYGVNVTAEISPKVLYLGEGITARDDLTVNYTILPGGNPPAGYDALSAEVDHFSVGIAGEESWEGYLIGSAAKGTGTAVFSFGTEFDPLENHYVQPVLNRGSDIEIRGDKVPLSLVAMDQAFQVDRIHLVNEFDAPIPGPIGSPYTDTYQLLSFVLPEPGSVHVTILDENMQARGTLVPETALAAGTYNFLLDYEQVRSAGFKHNDSPTFYVQLERRLEGRAAANKTLYYGRMSERTSTAKMLGQTMVHDVLIQDGSLNLSRQDLALAGRGPQLAFSRSYNNQNSPRGFKPLGRGWSHSLDMSLQVLSIDPNTSEPVPAWVSGLKGKIFTKDDLTQQLKLPTMIQVNGAVFKKKNGIWYAERSKHGKLEEIAGGWVFTAKDGTRYRYDRPHGEDVLVGAITDRNGNTQSFSYDDFGQLEKVTDAVGRELTFRYQKIPGIIDDHNTRLVTVTGPDGIELSFAYNAHGYLESASRANRTETYEYAREPGIKAGESNLVKATDVNGHSYTYEYFSPGEVQSNLVNFTRVLKSQDIIKRVVYSDDNAAAFQYDVTSGNKRIVTDLRGKPTTYTLNSIGNPTRIEEPLGKTTFMTWSMDEGKPDNVMTSRTDARGYKTTYEYDALGNVSKETDPDNQSIGTVWNQAFSLPEQRTDRNSVAQRWNYDPVSGNLNYQVDGDGKRTDYTYYPTGEVQTVTDPRQNVTSYTYDTHGNPDTVTGPEGSVSAFDFDVRGRKVAEIDPNNNRTVYAYDDLDYPATVTYPALTSYALPAGSNNVKTTDYDALGNLITETDRAGLTLTYGYTPRNQVESIVRSSGGQKTFGYDGNGNLTSESDWKGIATNHTYDALNRRDTTTNRLGDLMSMGYDLNGNLTSVTDYAGRVTNYEYDKLNRQTKVIQPALPNLAAGEIVNTYYFEADPKTNLKTVTDAEGHTTTFEYNGRYLRTKRSNALLDDFVWQYDDAGNLTSESDEEGRVTSYVYDGQDRRIAIQRPEGNTTGYQYDPAGNVRFVTDPRGNPTETTFDQWNRPWQMIDPDGYTTSTERDGEGREIKITDGNSHVRTFLRDARGLVLIATDAENQPTTFTYDTNGNVETVTNARGFVTRTGFDAEDRKLLTVEAEGTPEARTTGVVLYDKIGNPLQVRDGNNHVTVAVYNALNLPESVTDPLGGVVATTYDKNGKPLTVKNRRGFTTGSEYDPLGRPTKVTDPLLQTMVTGYDKVGNVKSVKDKRGIVTGNLYDGLNRLTEQSRAGVRLVSNEYDANGNQTAVVDAENHRTEQTFNGRNLLATTTFADSTTQSRVYDGVGNLLTLTDEEGKLTTSTYDNENRVKTVTFAGETSENVYDEVGNLVQSLKPKGNGRSQSYDGLNRLTSVREESLTTTYAYDANSNRLSEEDPLGHRVEFTYDKLNRKTAHIQRKNGGDLTVSYDEYDAEGNLKQLTDARGQVFGFEYDALNRPTLATYPSVATPYLTLQRIETGYDANNNVATVTETKTQNGGGTITDVTSNIWDYFDRLDSSTQRGVLLDYGYDNNGNRTSVVTANGSTTYTFDARNRLATAVVGSDTTTYSYTPVGLTDTVSYPNATSARYTYWPSNRVETITHKSGETVISSFAYTYDANGNRTRQIETQGGTTETTDYGYDDLDRLEDFTVTADADTTATAYTFEGYNRKTESVTVNGVATLVKTYSYDATNWLTGVIDSIAATTVSYGYDNNGNTVRKSASGSDDVLFVYDSRNQLVETKQGATLLGRYDYNAQGLRIRHRNSERGDVDYFYDDGAVLEERTAVGGLLAHYRYADRLLSLNTGSETQYYHHDALGSTVDLTDSSGSVKVRYTLDPWGQIRNQIGSSVNRMIFTGQEHDEQTGLIYFGARYYDPDTARFLTQDSYLGELGTPPSLHRYLYAYSNPTVYIDLAGYISNRQMIGIDDDSVDRVLSEDNSLSNVLKLTAKSTMYTLWNGVTGGFVGRQDDRQEKYDQGQLSDGEFWAGTGIDAGVSMAAQAVGGAVAGKATGAIGSKFAGTIAGGAIDSGVGSLVSQSGQVLTHEVTGGKLGQESIDFGDVATSAGSGMVMAGGLYAGQKVVGAIAAGVKAQTAPSLTREVRDGANSDLRNRVEANNAASNKANVNSKFGDHVKAEGRLYEKFVEQGKDEFWPPNSGFRGMQRDDTFQPGYVFDRLGSDLGKYVSPAGTKVTKRALPKFKEEEAYHVYEVIKQLDDIKTGDIREWFGKEGRGTQHKLPMSVRELIKQEYIKELFAQ